MSSDSGNLLCLKRAAVLLHRLNCRSFSIYCWHCKLAKCWSDRGRVTIFPQSMLKFPRYSTVATTSAIYAWFSGMFGTTFLICFMHRYGDYKTIAGWNWSRENDVEEIYYFLNTCWGIFFKQGFPFWLKTCLIFDHYSETVLLLCFSFYDGGADLWISEQQRWVAGFLPGKVMLQSRESVVEVKVCGFV